MTKTIKTQSQKVAEQNKKAVQKHHKDVEAAGELQKRVAAGELTAGAALQQQAGSVAPVKSTKAVEHLRVIKFMDSTDAATIKVTLDDGTELTGRRIEHWKFNAKESRCMFNGEVFINKVSEKNYDTFRKTAYEQAEAIAKRDAEVRAKLLAQYTPVAAAATMTVVNKDTEPKLPKEKKDPIAKDAFGCRVGSQAGDINLIILDAPHSKPLTLEWIAKRAELTTGRIKGHCKSLIEKGHMREVKGGFELVGKGAPNKGNKETKPAPKKANKK